MDGLEHHKHTKTQSSLYCSSGRILLANSRRSRLSRIRGSGYVDTIVEGLLDGFVHASTVLCDILRSGGIPGRHSGHQPSLYFAADDLEYQAAFPSQRLGIGAFRIAMESVFNTIHHEALEYVSFGKPNPFAFKNAEAALSRLQPSYSDSCKDREDPGTDSFKTLYMIGDNPSVDIKGARQAGVPWFSILTRTGVFRGEINHSKFPADLVVDTVAEAVDYILRRECIS